ncbi:MAG: SagB/ThcOx family dehydrogenase [Selenomonadaceae bacterium]|nr:SagB/ThcOx family dehydrogenase [Selenomonadaceae bacterium]
MEKTFDFMQQFLKDTNLDSGKDTALLRKEEQPPLEVPPCRDYPNVIRLPHPEMFEDKEVSFLQMIELRETVRQYSEQPMTLDELSFLLWCTQGVKAILPEGKTMRNVPSARAAHAFETLLLVNNVKDLEPGLYRFLALGHALQEIAVGENVLDEYLECFLPKNMIKKSGVTFIWTADFQRMAYSCGNRAARYIYIDAGHTCQNLYLAAQQKHIGVCAIGHFDDDKLNAKLNLDGRSSFTVYCATAGKAY